MWFEHRVEWMLLNPNHKTDLNRQVAELSPKLRLRFAVTSN